VHHCCAVAFIHGAVGVRQFTDEVVAQPAVLALRARVAMTEDPAVGVEEAYVTVRTRSGASFEKHIPYLRGGLQCPLSDADLEAKFLDQAALGAPGCDAQRIIDAIWHIDDLDDVAGLMRMLAPAAL